MIQELKKRGWRVYIAVNEGVSLKANEMAQLTVRNVDDQVVRALKQRAAARGRSAEAEHREILRGTLLDDGQANESFAKRAARLRGRLHSDTNSAELIRTDRDRDKSAWAVSLSMPVSR